MKKIAIYTMALVGLLFASCAKSEMQTPVLSGDQGAVSFRILASDQTRAGADLDYVIRIYSTEGLIRMYTSLEEMPATLSLLKGNYSIEVTVGNSAPATFTEKSYFGRADFEVVAGENREVTVDCPLLNAAVEVKYDAAVAANLEAGFVTRVALGSDALEYKESKMGYFLPSEEQKSITWNFSGTHAEKGDLTANGSFDIEGGKRYLIQFNFSPDAPGFMDFTITIVEPEVENDKIIFSAEPQFKSSEFNMDEPQVIYGTTRTFTVSAPNALSGLSLEVEGQTLDLASGTVSGAAIEKQSEKVWLVTISEPLFDSLTGGEHTLRFVALDSEGGEGDQEMFFISQGIVPAEASDYDLWLNTGDLRVKIYDPSVTTVSVKLRRRGGEWATYPATRLDESTFVAHVDPVWIETSNDAGDKAYQLDPNKGILANATYESQAIINGVEKLAVAEFLTSVDQPIPYADFEDSSLSCFTLNNGSSTFWGSGNNNYDSGKTDKLCAWSTFPGMGGNGCSKSTSCKALSIQLAAGNLFTGTFNMAGTTGTVGFGQPYDWKARPKAIRFKYAARVGTVDMIANEDNPGNPLSKGGPDRARIFAAIVDWNARHNVASGLSTPSGMWDPATQTSTAEGPIIAYSSLWIESGTDHSEMQTIELPMNYYDQVTKPSGTYRIVISFAANAYGDYMSGCSSNFLCVDDIEWVY